MKAEYFPMHLGNAKVSRRRAAKLGAAAGAAGLLTGLGSASLHTPRAAASSTLAHRPYVGAAQPAPPTDDMFDVAAVEAGSWAPGPYGPGDERGSYNEVTPQKTAAAMRLLDAGRPVMTYNLGEQLFEGFPAFPSLPPREYRQQLAVGGFRAPPGTIQLGAEPFAPLAANRLTYFEERLNTTYQIATQLDNLNHIGVGQTYYNGLQLTDLARPDGTARLGNEQMGPIATRGVLVDLVGLKAAQGATGDYFTASNGGRVLRDNYRVTVEDMDAALGRAGVGDVTPGDVVLFRTGWTHLVRTDPERYLMQEPGIYLREARHLAARRPAIVGGDTWGLEVLDPAVTGGNAFPVHQVLICQHGIRIGEGIVCEGLAEDGVFEFVYLYNPQFAPGATAGNTPPFALGQARRS